MVGGAEDVDVRGDHRGAWRRHQGTAPAAARGPGRAAAALCWRAGARGVGGMSTPLALDSVAAVPTSVPAGVRAAVTRLAAETTTRGGGIQSEADPGPPAPAIAGAGELLMVQRADSGVWLYPTGWADVGYSPAEVVVKEVKEEAGIDCDVVRPIAVLDGQRRGFTRIPLVSLVFHCRATGGELTPHPLECTDVGWFAEDALPDPTAGACLLYTSPSPRDATLSRMPSSA